jgi:hypothetical protein
MAGADLWHTNHPHSLSDFEHKAVEQFLAEIQSHQDAMALFLL